VRAAIEPTATAPETAIGDAPRVYYQEARRNIIVADATIMLANTALRRTICFIVVP
jgi:hypothetical protein